MKYIDVNPVKVPAVLYADVDFAFSNINAIVKVDPLTELAKAAKANITKVCEYFGVENLAVKENRVPMSFDIETTNVTEFKTIKGEKKCIKCNSYMYKWQFGIGNTIIHGRTWDQFITLMNAIKDVNQKMDYISTYRVFDANLGFEFQFMAPRFEADGWNISIFAREQRNPITAMFEKDGFFIIFQDALQISNCSLSKLAKNYDLPSTKKDGDLDYSKPRNSKTPLTAEEMEYCSYDCRVLNDFYRWIYVNYVDNGLPFPLTSTGLVRHDTKSLFNSLEMSTVTKGKKRYKKESNFRKSVLPRLFPETYTEYRDLVEMCYSGGFTHANAALAGTLLENVNGGDFTSSYPYTIMFQKFPMSQFIADVAADFDTIRNNNKKGIATIFKARFRGFYTTTTHSTVSISKCYEYVENGKDLDRTQKQINAIVDNGRVVYADVITLYLTDIDLIENLDRFYSWNDVEIFEVKTARYGYLPDYVREACALFYSKKNQLKKAGLSETTAYILAKAFVNSIYGMMVQKLATGEIVYKEGLWEKVVDTIEGGSAELNTEVAYQRQIFDAKSGKLKLFLSPYWGVYVTSHARGNLFTILRQIDKDVIYCDTDSIYYRNPEKWQKVCDDYNAAIYAGNQAAIDDWNNTPGHEEMQLDIDDFRDLGEFDKLNKVGNYSRFITLGAKRYLKEGPKKDKDTGEIKIEVESTIAGLPKKALTEYADKLGVDPFEIFTNGMKIPDCKKCHRYNDKPHFDTVVDEFGNSEDMMEFASVGIYDIDFTMKITDNYMKVMLTYAEAQGREDFEEIYREVMDE